MKFGPVLVSDALGAILGHAVFVGDKKIPKGTFIGPQELTAIQVAGIDKIFVARLDSTDMHEDAAAQRIAAEIAAAL